MTRVVLPTAMTDGAQSELAQAPADRKDSGYQARLPQLVPRLQNILLQAGSTWQSTPSGTDTVAFHGSRYCPCMTVAIGHTKLPAQANF